MRSRTWPGPGRPRRPVGMAGEVREAAHGGGDAAEAGARAPRPGLAERRHAPEHERGAHRGGGGPAPGAAPPRAPAGRRGGRRGASGGGARGRRRARRGGRSRRPSYRARARIAAVPPPAIRVAVKRLDPAVPLPAYAREDDAGLDLHAAHDVKLPPGGRAPVATGLAVAPPAGCAGFVLPRSGLALRHGVTILNAPGLIDAGYRGEGRVLLVNQDPARAVTLPRSERGAGGFGSTGC